MGSSFERYYRFPSKDALDRFMRGFDNWSGYSIEGSYFPTSKTGGFNVMQALPFARARVPWRIEGTTVIFDFGVAVPHFDPERLEKIYDFMLEQANLFGANISRTPW